MVAGLLHEYTPIACPEGTFPPLGYPDLAVEPQAAPTEDDSVALVEWRADALLAAYAIRDGRFWATHAALAGDGLAFPELAHHPVIRLAREYRIRRALSYLTGELGVGHLVAIGQVADDPTALIPATPEFVVYDLYAPLLAGRPDAPQGYLIAPLFRREAARAGLRHAPEVYRGGYDAGLVASRAGGKGLLDPRHDRDGVLIKLVFERGRHDGPRLAHVVRARSS